MNKTENPVSVKQVPNVKDLADLMHRYKELSTSIHVQQLELEDLSKSIDRFVNSIDNYFYGSSEKSETK